MSNTRARTLPQLTAAGGKPYHFNLDRETAGALQEALGWFEAGCGPLGKPMSFSESCIVRLALRDLCRNLAAAEALGNPEELEGVMRRIEAARGRRGRPAGWKRG